MTLKEYSEKKKIPYKTVATYVSFSGLKAVGHTRRGRRNTATFAENELDELFKNHKPNQKSGKPRKRRDTNVDKNSEFAQMAPYRNIKCPKYIGCMTYASSQKKSLLCENCENRNAESQDWLANEMAC